MPDETALAQSPQVFLRKAQVEHNSKRLLNWHRILHSWWDEIKSESPVKEVGEARWTPRYIKPAHDIVIRRLKQLNPKFEHDTPMGASIPLPRQPLILEENAVRAVYYDGEDVKLRADPRMAEVLQAAFGRVDIAADAEGPMDEPLYHLALIPAHKRPTDRSGMAREAYDAFVRGAVHPGRYIQGLAVLQASVLPGFSELAARKAGRDAAMWAVSGKPFPHHSIVSAARNEDLAELGIRLLGELMTPVEDMDSYRRGEEQVREKAVELGKIAGKSTREFEMRKFVQRLAEELK